MKHRKQIQIEWILAVMFIVQGLTVFLPDTLPPGLSKFLLLILLVLFTLYKMNFLDAALKKKFHEGGIGYARNLTSRRY
ncbi:MAG: hypothetical protein HFF01_08400 [Erysipelotrichaceae bacterium]|jgi:hypothetical protein|nr:hypothetical protein [Erysipelotrichaceae bacterium]MCI9525033.1 hypothetical protein [Erysipelotrichaceae bacterium]